MSTQETLIILAITSPLWAPFVGLIGIALILSMVNLVSALADLRKKPEKRARRKK